MCDECFGFCNATTHQFFRVPSTCHAFRCVDVFVSFLAQLLCYLNVAAIRKGHAIQHQTYTEKVPYSVSQMKIPGYRIDDISQLGGPSKTGLVDLFKPETSALLLLDLFVCRRPSLVQALPWITIGDWGRCVHVLVSDSFLSVRLGSIGNVVPLEVMFAPCCGTGDRSGLVIHLKCHSMTNARQFAPPLKRHLEHSLNVASDWDGN